MTRFTAKFIITGRLADSISLHAYRIDEIIE